MNAAAFAPPKDAKPLARIYTGGSSDSRSHLKSVDAALFASGAISVSVEYLTSEQLRKNKWTKVEFVEWLLGSHAHFILAYLTEALKDLEWDYEVLDKEMWKLAYHKGFPTGREVLCAVSRQDKFAYLAALRDFATPTLRVELSRVVGDKDWNFDDNAAIVSAVEE